jgi:hypothetical protein
MFSGHHCDPGESHFDHEHPQTQDVRDDISHDEPKQAGSENVSSVAAAAMDRRRSHGPLLLIAIAILLVIVAFLSVSNSDLRNALRLANVDNNDQTAERSADDAETLPNIVRQRDIWSNTAITDLTIGIVTPSDLHRRCPDLPPYVLEISLDQSNTIELPPIKIAGSYDPPGFTTSKYGNRLRSSREVEDRSRIGQLFPHFPGRVSELIGHEMKVTEKSRNAWRAIEATRDVPQLTVSRICFYHRYDATSPFLILDSSSPSNTSYGGYDLNWIPIDALIAEDNRYSSAGPFLLTPNLIPEDFQYWRDPPNTAIGIGAGLHRALPATPSMRVRTRRFETWEQAGSRELTD